MKRIVLLLMVLLVFGVSAGLWARGADEGEGQLHIGVATANFDDKWMSYMHDGFRAAAEEAGVRITMVDGKNDPAVQQGQIETFITRVAAKKPSKSLRQIALKSTTRDWAR